MKKAICIFCVLIASVLPSCKREELINIHVFVSSLNEDKNITKTDGGNLFASETDSEIKYAFRVNDDYLLGVTADKNTQQLKSCCVTYVYTSKKFTDETNEEFFNICKSVLRSYEEISDTQAEALLKEMKINQIKKIDSFHRKKDFYYYSFFKNKLGFSFTVETTRLNEEDSTDEKLTENQSSAVR